MAEGDAPAGGGGGGEGLADFVTRKVGPFPVWVYALAFAGIWYYLERKKSAAATSTTSSSDTTAGATIGTDPAGNTGEIDPATGYVYGTPEDTAALQQQSGSSSSSSGSSTTYQDNDAWADAAINYLVALGEDPTVANGAIEAYLASQTLTTAQQAMVNQAIQALGAPPQPPSPSSTTTVVSPPGGATTYATNPPTGLATSSVASTSIGLKWNTASNATGYTVSATGGSGSAVTVTSTTPSATLSGLSPSTSYKISVQATPADVGAASATLTVSTSSAVTGTPPKSPAPPAKAATHTYTVVHGDTLSSIAERNGTTLAVIKQLNPVYWTNPKYNNGNTIFAGDTVVLPGA